jgi:hypothetical protein
VSGVAQRKSSRVGKNSVLVCSAAVKRLTAYSMRFFGQKWLEKRMDTAARPKANMRVRFT